MPYRTICLFIAGQEDFTSQEVLSIPLSFLFIHQKPFSVDEPPPIWKSQCLGPDGNIRAPACAIGAQLVIASTLSAFLWSSRSCPTPESRLRLDDASHRVLLCLWLAIEQTSPYSNYPTYSFPEQSHLRLLATRLDYVHASLTYIRSIRGHCHAFRTKLPPLRSSLEAFSTTPGFGASTLTI